MSKKLKGNTLTDPKTKTLREAIIENAKGYIKIPPNQRPYSWTEKQFEDFINDIEDIRCKKGKSYHYFNMITYKRQGENIEIYDGQQRITTTYLTMIYLYNKIICHDDQKEEDINNLKKLIFKDGYKKLQLFSYNDSFLEQLVDIFSDKDGIKKTIDEDLNKLISQDEYDYKSNRNIIDFIKTLNIFVMEKSENANSYNYYIDFLESLLDKFEIFLGELGESIEPYKIFELVNNRGKGLTEIDLVKNYFYQIAADSEVNNATKNIEKLFKEIIEEYGDFYEDVLIKHWLIFYNEHSDNTQKYGKAKNIFESVKFNFKNKKKEYNNINSDLYQYVINFLEDILKNSNKINAMYTLFKDNKPDFETVSKVTQINISALEKIYIFIRLECFEYMEYYLYFLCRKKFDDTLKTDDELIRQFKYACAFYLFRSITNDRMSIDDLNYNLYDYLKDFDANTNDLNGIFAKFLIKDNYAIDPKEDFYNKLSADQRDIKGNIVKWIFLFNIEDLRYDKVFDSNNDVIEEEHIVPKEALKEKHKKISYSEYNIHGKHGHFKSRIDWIGNKLLLFRSDNVNAGKDFSAKIDTYYNVRNSQKYVDIYLKELEAIVEGCTSEEVNDDNYREKIKNYFRELNGVRKKNDFLCEVEERWRKKLVEEIKENDKKGFNFSDLNSQLENKRKQKEI